MLLNDAGSAWLPGTPPGSGSASNSQCVLSGAGSSVAISGNNLLVTYNVQFKPGFAGAKTIWTNAYSVSSGLGSAWQSSLGGTALSWTVPVPAVPSLVSFSPASGTGTSQAFTAIYSSPAGAADILAVQVLINSSLSASGGCYLRYDKNSAQFMLLNDAGNAWLPGTPPGSGSVSNSQCTLSGVGSSVTISGNNLAVIYTVQFKPAFAGAKTLWTNAYSVSSGLGSAWQSSVGGSTLSWTVPAIVPSLVSFSPVSGSGTSQAFTAVYSSPAGGADILAVQVLINSSLSASGDCYLRYDKNSGQFMLLNDAGTAWLPGTPPGSGSASNSQCLLSGAGSSVTISGNNLAVTYNVQFKPAFAGAKTIWTNAYSVSSGLGSTWQSSVGGVALTWIAN